MPPHRPPTRDTQAGMIAGRYRYVAIEGRLVQARLDDAQTRAS
jgi:hypothetical protein